MHKTYKASIIKSFFTFITGIFASIFVYILLNIFIKNDLISKIVGLIILLAFLYLIISDLKLKIIIENDDLIINEGNITYEFKISKCDFKYFIRNDAFYLYVIDENNKEFSFDCSILFKSKFDELLKDLKVIGKNAKVNYLITKKGE